MPGRARGDRLLAAGARRTSALLRRGRRPLTAAAVLRSAGRLAHGTGARADLLGEASYLELEAGREPKQLRRAYTAELARADALHRKGRPRAAAGSLCRALALACHRVNHIDRLSSPLSDDPAGFTAPLRSSTTALAVAAPQHRTSPAAAPPGDRPLRLLVLTPGNANFLPLITDRYEGHPGVELRTVHIPADPVLGALARTPRRITEARLHSRPGDLRKVEAALRPHLDWADTVFVEWCTFTAALVTLVDPGTARIVVRLHKYETFTHWPHLIDFSRVDDLVFVSDLMRDLTSEAFPGLLSDHGPRLHTLENAVDLRRFVRPKAPGARFNVAMTGMGQIAKDPLWALRALRVLRSHDSRYRMLLIGDGFDPAASGASRVYADALQRELAELESSGAVRRTGRTDDVPGALTEAGVILSSSVRESFHMGLVEGAASGALPVVRDWPFVAGRRHSARTLFPESWVVSTPEEAAQHILSATSTEESWQAHGDSAAQHALSVWDWSVVRDRFDGLLLGD